MNALQLLPLTVFTQTNFAAHFIPAKSIFTVRLSEAYTHGIADANFYDGDGTRENSLKITVSEQNGVCHVGRKFLVERDIPHQSFVHG